MLQSSAALALVLQCAQPFQLPPHYPVFNTHSTIRLDASGINGDVLPCPVLPAKTAVSSIERAEHGERVLKQDPGLSNASPLLLAEADLNQILPPWTTDNLPANSSTGATQPGPPPQPTYESWDVLRQYPRAAPLAQPSVPAPKPTENLNPLKESNDDQAAKHSTAP